MSFEEIFKKHAKQMWHIQKMGEKYSLKPDLQELSNPLLKLLLPRKQVNYYILKEDGRIKLFIEESDGLQDWKQNLIAYTVNTCIGGIDRKYHAGFYLTAMTVFNHLNQHSDLVDEVIEIYGYSHGAGALTVLGSLIRHRTKSELYNNRVIGFEPPRQAVKPSTELVQETINDIYYIQGNDIVCTVPMWMAHLGQTRKVPGRKLTGIKKLLSLVFNHDIYWTMFL